MWKKLINLVNGADVLVVEGGDGLGFSAAGALRPYPLVTAPAAGGTFERDFALAVSYPRRDKPCRFHLRRNESRNVSGSRPV